MAHYFLDFEKPIEELEEKILKFDIMFIILGHGITGDIDMRVQVKGLLNLFFTKETK